MLRNLPERLSDDELALVDQIGKSALPELAKANPKLFLACLDDLSILPRRAEDDITGERRIAIYAKLLGDYPAAALRFMTKTMLERCKWFPTPNECLAVIKEWSRDDDALKARLLSWKMHDKELEARFSDLCARVPIMSQDAIDALPDRIKWALDNKMILRRLPTGQFVARKPDSIAA